MNNKININQVEQVTGVSKRNIRFYEKEGLVVPERNDTNGYRVYGEEDIWRIKVIKMLRMLDMPLNDIREVLEKEQTLDQAISNQKDRLEEKTQELSAAIGFCKQLKNKEIHDLDVDQYLDQMEHASNEGFFTGWINDYKRIKEANKDRDFTFMPNGSVRNAKEFTNALFEFAENEKIDLVITKESMYPEFANKDRDFTFMPNGSVRNAKEFTNALFEFAENEKIDLVITKESMYPEFTMNGKEYTAERYYIPVRGIPVAYIHCYVKNREVQSENVPMVRRDIVWFLHKWWLIPVVVVLDGLFIWRFLFPITTLEEWVLVLAAFVMQGVGLFRYYLFHYNEKNN